MGYLLPPPKIWVHAQFGLPFHKFLTAPLIYSDSVQATFRTWCTRYGILLDSWAVPHLQLGPIPYKTFSFSSYSMKSMSLARRYTIDGLAEQGSVNDVPLWHSAVFKN